MRSVSGGRRATSKTGVRSAPAKKRNAAKKQNRPRHGQTSRLAASRGFARSRLSDWLENVQERIAVIRPLTALSIALIIAVIGYGLVVGGHVAMAANEVAEKGNRVLALAGFSIDDVTVTGRTHADKAALLAALDVERDDPIFGFDTEAARQRIERVDWVKSATVTRLLPDAIRIDLVERAPYAVWQRGGSMSIIDRDGYTITDDDLEDFAHLPFVVGFGGARHLEDVYGLMQQTQPQLLSRVRAFVRVGDRRWNLRLENGVDLKLPEVGVEQALVAAANLDRDAKIFSRDIVAVDLRLPDRVTVTLTPEAVAMRDGAMVPVKDVAGVTSNTANVIAGTNTGTNTGTNPATSATPVSFTTGGGNT